LFLGPGKIEISDIKIRVEGQWAYGSYKLRKGGEVIHSTDKDIFRKIKGKWYDVVENPLTPGYNREDLPPEMR
jgi:ketosteroid isomerase-like protein